MKFFRAVGDCLTQAFGEAGLDAKTRFASVCLGLSGGSEDKEAYARELIPADRYRLTHDAEVALIGGTAGEPGIIIISGTGSVAFGRNRENKTARAGGWGYIFGDEGGGFDTVRQALRAALQYEEGWGPATKLHQVLLEVSGAASANALMHGFYNQFDRTQIAGYARHVTEAAEAGDEVALEIVRAAARGLGRCVAGVYGQLFRHAEVVPIVAVGGGFQSNLLRQTLKQNLQFGIGCPLERPKLSPAAGALIEALRLDGNASLLTGLAPGD